MKKSVMSFVVKCSVIIIALFGVIMCACWYPFSISLTTIGPIDTVPTVAQYVEMYSQLAFYWFVSIPCFIILIFAWKFSNDIKRDDVFNMKTVKRIRHCVVILLADLVVYVIGNLIFMLIGWNDFAILYFIIAIIGLVITCILAVVSHYVSKAAILQEEAEGTI